MTFCDPRLNLLGSGSTYLKGPFHRLPYAGFAPFSFSCPAGASPWRVLSSIRLGHRYKDLPPGHRTGNGFACKVLRLFTGHESILYNKRQ